MTSSPSPAVIRGATSGGRKDVPQSDSRDNGGWFGRLWTRLTGRGGESSVREAIEELIDESDEVGSDAIDADERALLSNILRLHEATAEDVMVPRAEIAAVDASTSLQDLVEKMSEEAHSRIPIYRETLDDVIGFVHIKDVLQALHKSTGQAVPDLARDILFAAPSIQVLDLLLQMRASRVHMAIVVDEYGGVDGLVTIEDLVEEIVGEIEDEHDEDGPLLAKQANGSIVADATARIEELEALIGDFATETERQETDTLGGIVFSTIDRVPRRGEVVAHSSGVEFEVVDADARRIKKLRIVRPQD